MKTTKLFTLLAVLVCSTTIGWAQTAWLGSGNSTDPYLLNSSNEWEALAKMVAEGKNFQGQYFRLSADIDTKGIQVGSVDKPFCGTFDGDNHTLKFTVGEGGGDNIAKEASAPFGCLRGAIVRHVKTTGAIWSSNKLNGAIATVIDGEGDTRGTKIIDCRSDVDFWITYKNGLTSGGLVGKVNSNVTVAPVFEKCAFTGHFRGWGTQWGGLVGWSDIDITFKDCMFDPAEVESGLESGSATFVRLAKGAKATFDNCYCTRYLETKQGICVFNKVNVPADCSYEMVDEPFVQFDGNPYWRTGDHIKLTVPEGKKFNHWEAVDVFLSDPWRKDGIHQLQDVNGPIHLYTSEKSIPEGKEYYEHGVLYRYLNKSDYHYFVSDETCKAKGWKFHSDNELVIYDGDGNASHITAIVGCMQYETPSDGVQILNDIVEFGSVDRDHTRLGIIAPRAFADKTELKSLYFKDTNSSFHNALLGFDFMIQDEAFKNCPNLEEIKMMQYTTEGTDHWEALKPGQVFSIASSAFDGSPNTKISCYPAEYQGFLTSETWAPFQNRIIVYNATNKDFDAEGTKYTIYRDLSNGNELTTSDKKYMMENYLPLWNADYKDFNAAELLTTNDDAKVSYVSVAGISSVNDEGVMRIYNDPGEFYNYKTICLPRNAIAGNTDVKAIEFYQTNGRSDNSHSELKMVIQNGAFEGCKNLKELRMFYYVEDGEDHWTCLGPQDVIPGDNIFGKASNEEMANMGEEELRAEDAKVPDGFKVLVSTERYQEFINDPNWVQYLPYIKPVEYDPANKRKDYNESGLNYSYMTNPGGIMQTSQVVSQDVSWWTAPRIAIEVALVAATIGGSMAVSGGILEQAATVESLQTYLTMANGLEAGTDKFTMFLGAYASSAFGSTYPLFNDAVLMHTVYRNMIVDGILRPMEELAGNQVVQQFSFHCLFKSQLLHWSIKEAAKLTQLKIRTGLIALLQESAMSSSAYLASQCWGGSGSYNSDALKKGMRENIKSNIHQVGFVGGGYIITTPSKNIVYHTYFKSVDDSTKVAKIYGGFDQDHNAFTSDRTMTFAKKAFHNKTNLERVEFYANTGQSSRASMPMELTIPDSAFVGCTNLKEFNTLLIDNDGGRRALGPENFILAGDSIFAGLDPEKFHIVIDINRKQDFLDNESWAPLERYFVYKSANPKNQHTLYGANYAYAYELNSIQKVEEVQGHKVEHTIVTGPDNEFIEGNQGAVKLINDLGNYNNYQLDYVAPKAFYGNKHLRSVSFTDVNGFWWMGDCYTGLDVTLQDSCFANCKNLANVDLVYMKTDGINELQPMTPQQIKVGKGVLDGTSARFKMMPQQVSWFEADSTWAKYKDRFMPCLIRLSDPGIKEALEDMAYYDPANSGTDNALWKDYCDLARIGGAGFSWLDGKFQAEHENIYAFGDFKHFESVGLNYVGKSWFEGCSNMGNILLPATITDIRDKAFKGCSALKQIELPQGVATIGNDAFAGCSNLNTISVLGEVPATIGTGTFHKHNGLQIYVPTGKVADYKTAWSEYADYIVEGLPAINKVVTVTETGQLADKLGLTLVEQSSKVRYIQGPYTQYDSLTVSGPLNGRDLAVIRHMAGADAYDSDWTDGRLKYLNLWNADLKKDEKNSYNGNGSDEYMKEDNLVPPYLFENCEAIETVILPKSATKIGENLFEDAKALKRVCVGRKTTWYDTDLLQNLNGIEELVFLTDGFANNDSYFYSDPWEAPISSVITTQEQIGNYISDLKLVRRAQSVQAPFEDDAVIWTLADKGQFFPSSYLVKESVESIFNGNTDIKKFDDFSYFGRVKRLENTFAGNSNMTTITLPDSLEYISASAFSGCAKLDTIHVSCDSVPVLEPDAFESLPADFRILVPKPLCKLYRDTWTQYADHINVDWHRKDDLITVTVTEPNTLAKALGLTTEIKHDIFYDFQSSFVSSLKGDYSHIRRLKVVGPISGADFDVLRYMAGYCPWTDYHNSAGHLEYLDLYDADIKGTDIGVRGYEKTNTVIPMDRVKIHDVSDNELPIHAFLRADQLQTLVLPKTCKKVLRRALQECEGLEVLVIGDDMEDFNWNALDDDAMLTRMYILAKKKVSISTELAIWRKLCNNYNPTFDAFYVRPSLYDDYLRDGEYTGSSWQRTNNISRGMFDDDESFCVFAAHGTASRDDLIGVNSVKGWFKDHTGIRDLTPLAFTTIDSLCTADIQPLTQLEKIVLPMSLEGMEDGLFSKATNLRYVDMQLCDSTNVIDDLKNRGFTRLGIDSLQTLVYLPLTYGESNGTNIVVGDAASMNAQGFRLVDKKDYCVPYAFKTDKVENTRTLAKSTAPYSVCLPYDLPIPADAKAYKLSGRSNKELIFTETTETLKAMYPYLIWTTSGDALLNTAAANIPANGATTVGQQDDAPGYSLRGTLNGISNADAADMGAYTLQNDGMWHPVKSDTQEHQAASILPYRAYLLQSARANGNRAIGMTLEGTTGIEQLRTIDRDGTERIYDLNGRQLSVPTKGVNIINGKKIINK